MVIAKILSKFGHELPVWQLLDTSAALLTFRSGLKAHYSALAWASALNEEQTEDALIAPILGLLGWENCTIAQVSLPVQNAAPSRPT